MYFKNCEVAFGKRDDFARNAKLQSALVVFCDYASVACRLLTL